MPEITQEELDQFEAYKQLGTIESIAESRETANIDMAVRHSGFKKTVLTKLIKGLPEGYSMISSNDGVVIRSADGEEKDLVEFAEEEWADFLPSLKSEEKKESSGIPYIVQSTKEREAGTKNVGKKVANNYITQRYGAVLKAESVN